MRIFSELYTRIVFTQELSLSSSFRLDELKCLTILTYAIIDNEVAGRRTLAKNDRNGRFELKIARNVGFLPPPPLMIPTDRVKYI